MFAPYSGGKGRRLGRLLRPIDEVVLDVDGGFGEGGSPASAGSRSGPGPC